MNNEDGSVFGGFFQEDKWYCYRNNKTGEEFKLGYEIIPEQGFELIKVYDLSVTEKERKAK